MPNRKDVLNAVADLGAWGMGAFGSYFVGYENEVDCGLAGVVAIGVKNVCFDLVQQNWRYLGVDAACFALGYAGGQTPWEAAISVASARTCLNLFALRRQRPNQLQQQVPQPRLVETPPSSPEPEPKLVETTPLSLSQLETPPSSPELQTIIPAPVDEGRTERTLSVSDSDNEFEQSQTTVSQPLVPASQSSTSEPQLSTNATQRRRSPCCRVM